LRKSIAVIASSRLVQVIAAMRRPAGFALYAAAHLICTLARL
jgi:hypothetical protein